MLLKSYSSLQKAQGRNLESRGAESSYVPGAGRAEKHAGLYYFQLTTNKDRMEYSRTFMGKYFNVLGHFFSIYCIWKIFICTVNIVFDRVGKVDPVTKGIEIAVHHMGFDIDVRFSSSTNPSGPILVATRVLPPCRRHRRHICARSPHNSDQILLCSVIHKVFQHRRSSSRSDHGLNSKEGNPSRECTSSLVFC